MAFLLVIIILSLVGALIAIPQKSNKTSNSQSFCLGSCLLLFSCSWILGAFFTAGVILWALMHVLRTRVI